MYDGRKNILDLHEQLNLKVLLLPFVVLFHPNCCSCYNVLLLKVEVVDSLPKRINSE